MNILILALFFFNSEPFPLEVLPELDPPARKYHVTGVVPVYKPKLINESDHEVEYD